MLCLHGGVAGDRLAPGLQQLGTAGLGQRRANGDEVIGSGLDVGPAAQPDPPHRDPGIGIAGGQRVQGLDLDVGECEGRAAAKGQQLPDLPQPGAGGGEPAAAAAENLVDRLSNAQLPLKGFSQMAKVLLHNLKGDALKDLGRESALSYGQLAHGVQVLRDWISHSLNLSRPRILVMKPAPVEQAPLEQ